jgi:hypothetical protein
LLRPALLDANACLSSHGNDLFSPSAHLVRRKTEFEEFAPSIPQGLSNGMNAPKVIGFFCHSGPNGLMTF